MTTLWERSLLHSPLKRFNNAISSNPPLGKTVNLFHCSLGKGCYQTALRDTRCTARPCGAHRGSGLRSPSIVNKCAYVPLGVRRARVFVGRRCCSGVVVAGGRVRWGRGSRQGSEAGQQAGQGQARRAQLQGGGSEGEGRKTCEEENNPFFHDHHSHGAGRAKQSPIPRGGSLYLLSVVWVYPAVERVRSS